MFSFRARAEKGIAPHIEQRGWDLVIFDWFVLSMRMQVVLDSSFARPGSAPILGGKKVEFRDWTKTPRDNLIAQKSAVSSLRERRRLLKFRLYKRNLPIPRSGILIFKAQGTLHTCVTCE